MPKPTTEQLGRINRFSMRELTEDDVVVFSDLMIDDQVTSYSSKVHPSLLRKFIQDANGGVGLLMSHNTGKLPVGRSFGAEMKVDYDNDGREMKTVYGEFYIDLGRQTESGMSTDDIAKGIESGTIFDTSIGFSADRWECTICGNDIRDWRKCDHFPGTKYVVNRDGEDVAETCYVVAGSDGQGELIENSLVYAGACNRATIVNNFSKDGVRETEKGTKLHLIDNFKNIPLNTSIYQYFTKDGSVLYTESPERTNGLEELMKRSEGEVEFAKFKEVLDQFGVKAETPEQLSVALQEAKDAQEKLSAKETENAELQGQLEKANSDNEEMKGQLTTKDETIQELSVKNEELAEKAELGKAYREELTEKALEAGVRAQGNAFNKAMYSKFLGTLSVDEIKEFAKGFEAESQAKFSGAKTTATQEPVADRLANKEPQGKEDFDNDVDFRNFVADKAVAYSNENGVSLKEATKLMYEKYSKDGSEE